MASFNIVLLVILGLTCFATGHITNSLAQGICLCVAEGDTFAYLSPSVKSEQIGRLQMDDCFVSHGGMYHVDDTTWYRLKEVNGKLAWVDGYFLRAKPASFCPNSGAGPVSNGIGGAAVNLCVDGGNLYFDGDSMIVNGISCVCNKGSIQCT